MGVLRETHPMPVFEPPAFDGFWWAVAASSDIGVGEVKKASLLRALITFEGRSQTTLRVRSPEIVVWRGIDGIAQTSEARCAHQFVHFAIEGRVDGCELVCNAHFWRFDRDGFGTTRDSAGRREPVTAIDTFVTREADESVWAYFPSVWFDVVRSK